MSLGKVAEALVLVTQLSYIHSLVLIHRPLLSISLRILPLQGKVEAQRKEHDQASQPTPNCAAFGIEWTVSVSLRFCCYS